MVLEKYIMSRCNPTIWIIVIEQSDIVELVKYLFMVHFRFKNGLAGKSLSAHNSFKSFIFVVVMLVMTTSTAFAEVYEVIDGLHYKLDTKMKTATLLPRSNGYSDAIVIPEKIKGNDRELYTVVALGDSSFSGCTGLTSITIPFSVTSIGGSFFL